MNRLASEHSPYLLQHAANPVDWYPWGEEAFSRARRENLPVFLSVGYATCHWCHVMAHESFEDPGVAALLNAGFVPVKVDREERPDVDRLYMLYVQATTGSGGWPMSVWLTPRLEPFFGGTYFPPDDRYGRPGFKAVLREISRAWREDREGVSDAATRAAGQLGRLASAARRVARDVPGTEVLDRAVGEFHAVFDRRHGGFGGAPKFPRPSDLLFLLQEFRRTGSAAARGMVLGTLQAMARGGIRDHVGGGFHRYAVDAGWRVPHFEKMLYDQAQLVLAYLGAADAFPDASLAAVAKETLEYVLRDVTGPEGEFYSAEDADSLPARDGAAGRKTAEGAFYVWDAAEVAELLGDESPLVAEHFGIAPAGNAPADPHGEFSGKNLLYVAKPVADLAAARGRALGDVEDAVGRARAVLRASRSERPRPLLDDKVLTAWNGLMIAAFAQGARGLRSDAYLRAAQRAAAFARSRVWDPVSRTLFRRFRRGSVAVEGFAEDYASLVWGLTALYQADGDAAWLDWALELQQRQDELFWDGTSGGWFATADQHPHLLVRLRDEYDGAEPSATSIGARNLMALAGLTGERLPTSDVDLVFRGAADALSSDGRRVPLLLAALSVWHSPGRGAVSAT